MGEIMRWQLILAATLVAVATALPIGQEGVESVSLVSEQAGSPNDAYMQKAAISFGNTINQVQKQTHPDLVSQALSDDMSEESREAKTLAKLQKDSEEIGDDSDDQELGETNDDYLPVSDGESAEEKKLDAMAKQAKKNEAKTEKAMNDMASSVKEQEEVKKAGSSVKAEAKKALAAAAALDSKDGNSRLGEGKYDPTEDMEINKLDKMAAALKSKEKKTLHSMKSIETGYEKQREATKKMKEFKKATKTANKLADASDDSDSVDEELGESDDDLDNESDVLEQLQKSTVKNIEDDEISDMVSHGKKAINDMASTALDSINQLP